jgi:hypothetical protein
VPWWLNEGLAEYLSRSVEQTDLDLMRRAYEENRILTLAQLEASQLERLDPTTLRLAYAQSLATVNLMITRYGQNRVTQVLSDIAAGIPSEEALKRIYRRGYPGLEEEVAASILR